MEPIEIATFAQLLERRHELACYCPGCQRWASCDLAMLVAAGMGDRNVRESRPRCRKCGSRGQWQLRQPAPTIN